MTEKNDVNATTPEAIEIEARRSFDFLYGEKTMQLALEKAKINGELYALCSKGLTELRSTFLEFSSSIDPIRTASPVVAANLVRLLSQAISEAIVVGGIFAVTPAVREHYQHPAKQEKREAGLASGIARRNSRKWVPHATELIVKLRNENSKFSQEKLAEEVIVRWKEEAPPPGVTTLKKFISEMELRGHLPKRSKQ